MLTLLEEERCEIEVKKSRFISIALPVTSLKEVKDKVKKTWEEYPDATHVVHAAVVGQSGTEFSFSDDREPKNTAGRPALEVLKGSGITNICVCIIRYFGGTLLGTGGLVKAYSDATKEVLKKIKTEKLTEKEPFTLKLNYDHFTLVKRALVEYEINSNETFGEYITITGDVKKEDKASFVKKIQDIGQGKITIII